MRWVTIAPDGVMTERDDEPTLSAMQEAVGGYIEAIPAPRDLQVTCYVNEVKQDFEGTPLRLNSKATVFLGAVLWPGARIVGTLVVAGPPDADGEIGDLPLNAQVALRERFGG